MNHLSFRLSSNPSNRDLIHIIYTIYIHEESSLRINLTLTKKEPWKSSTVLINFNLIMEKNL